MDELTADFVTETRETLERIAGALIAWEIRPDDAVQLDEIFRFVHTVKGSCGFLDLPRIAALAHAAESVLAEVRSGTRAPTAPLVAAILAAIDRIAKLVDALEGPVSGLPDEDADLIAAVARGEELVGNDSAAEPARADRTVRIAVPLLETMMTQVSELVLARNEMARTVRLSGQTELDAGFSKMSTIVGELRESVTRTRMQPIDRLFATLPRLVRDTARACGKPVALELVGHDVEIDREMVDAIRDPLIHIVRNAIDHGIEDPDARAAAGKSATSVLRVIAYQSGNQVSVEVVDDGRGIDTTKLIEKAVATKVVDPARAARLDDDEAAALIFEPGLSTATNVTEISGRGVGMDVVRANIERLGGSVVLANRPGEGLSVTLRAPLTLSIVTALIVRAGDQRFAIPRGAIEEIVKLGDDRARIERVGAGTVAVVRGDPCPALVLSETFNLPRVASRLAVLLSTATGGRFALGVDAVEDHEELVVRPMAPQLVGSGLFAGQSLGDDGCPILVLDAVGLAARARVERRKAEAEPEVAVRAPSILCATAFDGRRIGIRAMLVERLVATPRSDWSNIGARVFLALDGRHIGVAMVGALPAEGEVMAMLVADGMRRVAIPVAQVHDLVPCPDVVPVGEAGVEGLMRIEGSDVELLDADALLDQAVRETVVRGIASIALDDTPWVRGILAPLLAASGYDVRYDRPASADLVVCFEDDVHDADARLTLARHRNGDVDVARYDRATLQSAIDAVRRAA